MTTPLTAPLSLNPDLALNGLEPTRNAQTASPAPDVGPETLDFKAPRRAGPLSKIANLPPEIRVIINQMIEDETRTRIEQEFHLFGKNPHQSEVIRGNPHQSEANHLSKNFPDPTSTATPNTPSPPQS
jgi:hypothetical protein